MLPSGLTAEKLLKGGWTLLVAACGFLQSSALSLERSVPGRVSLLWHTVGSAPWSATCLEAGGEPKFGP